MHEKIPEVATSQPRRLRPYTIHMKTLCAALLALIVAAGPVAVLAFQLQSAAYLGFDRNDYPGDENLPALRETFSFTSYWLNNPPGTVGAGSGRSLRVRALDFCCSITDAPTPS